MWSDEKEELKQSVRQSITWAMWYVTVWVVLMIPVAKMFM